MECNTCHLTSICKIFDFVNHQKALAHISVDNCRVKQGETISQPLQPEQPQKAQEVQEPEIKVRSAESIANVSERIKQLSAPEPTTEETFSVCPSCDEGARPEEIIDCENCKKQLCVGCAVEDVSSKLAYCEECYDEL